MPHQPDMTFIKPLLNEMAYDPRSRGFIRRRRKRKATLTERRKALIGKKRRAHGGRGRIYGLKSKRKRRNRAGVK